jgi:hypothetical protein
MHAGCVCSNLLSMKRFHGARAVNGQERSLKSRIRKSQVFSYSMM